MTASAYILPEGNVQIAFSGGRTSGFLLHEILEANGGLPSNAVVTFQNTSRERPETLDFKLKRKMMRAFNGIEIEVVK